MDRKFFNSEVITPLVKASSQNAAFVDGDIVFDWTSFDIPKGGAKLLGATFTIRHNKVASQVAGLDFLFAKDNGTNSTPTSIGTGNAILGVTNFNSTDVIGYLNGKNEDYAGITATAASYSTTSATSSLVLSGSGGGSNIGYDRYYVAGIANGALDLRSLVALDDDVDVSGNSGTITTLDGTAPNVVFAAGDVLHVDDDIILGEVASVTTNNIVLKFDGSTSTNHSGTYTVPADIAAWRIQNGAGAAGDLSDDDLVYNVFPIRLTLHLEK